MAINRSEVATIVQEAASRMNLSLEIEQEIMESLESEYINDVWQLHYISSDHWKSMGAPIGFLASLEACMEEAGFAKDGKSKSSKSNRRKSAKLERGWKSVGMTDTTRTSGGSKSSSGRSVKRQPRSGRRSTSRDTELEDSNRSDSGRSGVRSRTSKDSSSDNNSGRSTASERLAMLSDSRQTALKELKDRLREQTKQGLAQREFDTKGNKIYEWDQNNSCVLLYVTWPFKFEFGPSTKFKCTISKDTLLLKAKNKVGQKSLRYTTGGLVNTLHSEWCVVSKGKAASGSGQNFAVELALFKKNVGEKWSTALIAKHIGTSHMSPDEIRAELKSYGLDPGTYSTHDELLKALRMARAKGNSNFSAMGPNRPKPIGRSRSADDVQLYDGPKSPGSLSSRSTSNQSPGSLSNSKRSIRRARSTSADRPLVADTSVNKFSEGQIVYYTSSDGQHERAKILKIHLDDDLVPFYDIRMTESGKEKQTTDSHLSLLTDDLFVGADISNRSEKSESAHSGNDTSSAQPTQPSTATTSQPVPGKSRFTENQLVYYTNNGEKEKAKILKIHLDDDLIPFYDIKLLDSDKEKQTTDSRLSVMTDDVNAEKKSRFMANQVVYFTDNGNKEKAKILGIHLGDADVPYYDIRIVDSGDQKQATDEQLSSLTDDLFKAAAQGQAPRSGALGPPEMPGPLRELPERSRSMDASGLAGAPVSPGPLMRGRRAGKRQSATIPAPAAMHRAVSDDKGGRRASTVLPQTSRFTENQVVYYTNNGQKTHAKILKIHLDDDLVPFYDIRLLDSGNEKQTTDGRLSSLTDDLFKAAVRSGSVGPGPRGPLPAPPERKAPGRSRSMGSSGVSGLPGSSASGPLKKGRRNGPRNSGQPPKRRVIQPGSGNIENIKKELAEYGGMSPSNFKYEGKGEMIAAWRFIQDDSKLSVGKLKQALRELGQSTEYIEKKEMVGALCKARVEQKRGGGDRLSGSDRAEHPSSSDESGPSRFKVQRRNSDGPLSMLKQGKRRGGRGR